MINRNDITSIVTGIGLVLLGLAFLLYVWGDNNRWEAQIEINHNLIQAYEKAYASCS